MAKIQKLKEKRVLGKLNGGHVKGGMTQFTVRIPNEWVPTLNAFVENKAQIDGFYRVSDIMRELIYKTIILPVQEAQ